MISGKLFHRRRHHNHQVQNTPLDDVSSQSSLEIDTHNVIRSVLQKVNFFFLGLSSL
jgi:hypothetical protein